jgi:hypothetical protein
VLFEPTVKVPVPRHHENAGPIDREVKRMVQRAIEHDFTVVLNGVYMEEPALVAAATEAKCSSASNLQIGQGEVASRQQLNCATGNGSPDTEGSCSRVRCSWRGCRDLRCSTVVNEGILIRCRWVPRNPLSNSGP